MSKFVKESAILVGGVILAFVWTNSESLNYYTLQLIGLLMIVFLVNHVRGRAAVRAKQNGQPQGLPLQTDGYIFTLTVFLLIGSTGGLASPLFFLTYFLLFGLSLMFQPKTTLVLVVTVIILYLSALTGENIVQLGSLALVTPLALFFSRQYFIALNYEEKIQLLKEEEIILDRTIKKEETDILLWESLEFKKNLTFMLDQVSLLLADISHLPNSQKERLLNIRAKILELMQSGEELKKEVDKEI